MGWKYEVETYYYENSRPDWETSYQGDSLWRAVRALLKARKAEPGRCYRLVVR